MYESRICGKSRCSAEHKTFAQLVKEFEADGNLYIRNRNEQGRFMKPIITDCDGNEISTDNPKGLTGVLDYDGDYRRFTCLSVYDAIHKGSGYEWHKALVKEIYRNKEEFKDCEVTVSGWIRNIRDFNQFFKLFLCNLSGLCVRFFY